MTFLPSLAQFRARFPAMKDADDDLVAAHIKRAPLYMRSDLPQAFITEGALLLAAHNVSLEGFGQDSETSAYTRLREAGVVRMTDGPTTVQFQTDATTGQAGGQADAFKSTRYGREFLALIKSVSPFGTAV